MDAEKTKWCFVCLILVIYEHSCNKDIHIGGMLEKNSVKKRLMEGEEGNVFIYLIWRVIYRMHDKWMAKLINWEIDSSLCQCELVISCQSLSDAIVTFTTVPGSQIRPYSPLYQSSEPGFLTEEWERFPDWSKEQECLLLFLKSCSDGLYKLNPLLYFLKKNFFTWNCNRTECITVFFPPSWKTNPGHVWYGCNESSGVLWSKQYLYLTAFHDDAALIAAFIYKVKGNISTADKDEILYISPILNVHCQNPLLAANHQSDYYQNFRGLYLHLTQIEEFI